jgi:predicted MFS family arabinose efflux permease
MRFFADRRVGRNMYRTVLRQPMFRYLMVLTICSTVGLQTWRTLFNNFAADVVGLEGSHIGMIQSVREVPGFLALLVVYVLLVIREHRLSALSVLFLGLGVAATGFFPSYAGLLLTTMVFSLGFHYYETTNQSLTLQYFDQQTSPWVIGKLRAFAAASNIAVGAVIWIAKPWISFQGLFTGVGLMIVAASLWAFAQEPTQPGLPPQHKKMIFRRRYSLYYFLTFMSGARRQIFMAFAVFLLVTRFGFSVREVTLLFVVNNIINYFTGPLIGKAIIRFGERRVLSLEYGGLILVFMGYALTQSPWVAGLLYLIDHLFFNFSIAIQTYFQKIADPRDTAPSMAVGFTINHIAAVLLPAVGGLLWMVDYRIPFVAGAAMSLVSLLASQRIPGLMDPATTKL